MRGNLARALEGRLPRDPGERLRYFAGRDDWEDDRWQDHCGYLECIHCKGEIPSGDKSLAARRAAFAASILGAGIDDLDQAPK